jgi:hypothetical protein
MKNILDLIKTNPLVTASAIVSALGFVLIGYIYFVAAPSQSAANSETLKEQKQIQDRMKVSVPLPNEDPNAPADMVEVVINQRVISEVGDVYSRIQDDYEDILVRATDKNLRNHAGWLLGGGNIWPDANPQVAFDYYVAAASDYRTHFKALFNIQPNGQPANNSWNMPVMSAGSPPTPEEIEEILALSAFEYVSSVGAQSANDLSQNQAEQLFAEQRMTLMNALNQRARRINLYVQLPPEEDRFAPEETDDATGNETGPAPGGGFAVGRPAGAQGEQAAEYPFIIQPWAFSDQPPTPDQLWEGQVQLWIMRDIMIAISEMNSVGKVVKEMGPDGTIQNVGASVVNSPIKRLLSLKTLPGYVGLHNTGAALGGGKTESTTGGPLTSGNELFNTPVTPSPTIGVGQGNEAEVSVYPAPPLELAPKESTDRAVEHFGITPTGRVSNATFDVRHTQLIIDIEADALPDFLETLRQTNFMTVIKAKITDLDEYELLQQGYVYGHNDVVRAELVIESLWFRNWTQDLMPKIVKEKLLIILPEVTDIDQQYEDF